MSAETARFTFENYDAARERQLGHLAVHEKLHNNDPLAHVWRIAEADDPESVKSQVRAEFETDIGERSGHENPIRHFYKTWEYKLVGNDLISDTGLSLRNLLKKGREAAWNDAREDRRYEYHARRADVQSMHPDMIIDWRKSGDRRCVRLASLCPDDAELSRNLAELGSYKPDRQMASIWIFEPTESGVRLHAFSQDNLSLDGQAEIDRQLGIDGSGYDSTMAKLGQLDYLPFTDGQEAVDAHRQIHDANLSRKTSQPHHFGIKNPKTYEEAVGAVQGCPEAWELYWDTAVQVADSLKATQTTNELAAIILKLRGTFNPQEVPRELNVAWRQPFNEEQAGQLMDYLRERAIPQYVFGAQLKQGKLEAASGYDGIAAAGAYAIENNIRHLGDCQTSPENVAKNQTSLESEMAAALNIYVRKEFDSKWCPNCLKKPQPGKSVKAWRQGDRIGCYDCGREQDVCTGQIIKRGRAVEHAKEPGNSGFELIADWFRKEKQQRQIRKLAEQQARAELGDNVSYIDIKLYEKQLQTKA